MNGPANYRRMLTPRLLEALADTPVVLVHGPRQCGKTTLARMVGEESGYSYITFDDENRLSAAREDPVAFVAELPARVILDEVQRVPELFLSLKAAVDADRQPGRFLLTGSANVLLLPKLADSLAGRMEILRLHPFAQCEVQGRYPGFFAQLFVGRIEAPASARRMGAELAEVIVAGGFPAVLARSTPRRRSAWYRDYIESLILRDVRELTQIRSMEALPRLLQALAAQSSNLQNVSALAAPFQLSRPTIREYMTLLARIFLVDELAPWHSNQLKRLVKTPKVHLGDTGLACNLLGVGAEQLWQNRPLLGAMLESFLFQEIRRHASWYEEPVNCYHFRDKDGVEVDLVLESAGQVAGVEVKAASTIRTTDFKGLRKLRDTLGETFTAGVLFYDGDTLLPFGDRLWALPISSLL